MEAKGALSSWLTIAKNSARSRSSSSTSAMSCMVTTTDSTAPSSERMGVAFSSTVTLRPSGTPRTISSARSVSPHAQQLRQGELPQGDLPPVAAHAGHHVEEILRTLLIVTQAVHDAYGLPVEGHRSSRRGVEDHTPTGEV